MNSLFDIISRRNYLLRLFLFLVIGISRCTPKANNFTIAPIENIEFLVERYFMTQAENADTSLNQFIINDKGGRYLKVSNAEEAFHWFRKNRNDVFLQSPYKSAIHKNENEEFLVVRNTSKEASLDAFGKVLKTDKGFVLVLNNPDEFSAYRAQFLEQSLFIFDGDYAIASPIAWKLSENKDSLFFEIDQP
jgi:hypothetical protein